MELRPVESLEELGELRTQFLALERRLPDATPYVTHRWVTAHWTAFRDLIDCRALCVFDEGRLVGWLPLAWTRGIRRLVPPRILRPAGQRWGILTVPCDADRPDVATSLLRGLGSRSLPGWDMILLGPLRATDQAISAYQEALAAERLVVELRTGRNPFVPLGVTWEAFLDHQSRNFRRTAGAKLEGLERDGRFRIRHQVDPSWQQLREGVLSVSAGSWQGAAGVAVGATDRGQAFYRSILEPDESFQVHLTTIEQDDRCIAYLVGLVRSNRYHAFDTGFDPEHRDLSPGLVVHLALLRELCGRGVGELDLGFDAAYKQRFAPRFRAYFDLRIFSGPVSRSLWSLKQRVRASHRES